MSLEVEAIVLFLEEANSGIVADNVELLHTDRRSATFQVTFPLMGAPVVQEIEGQMEIPEPEHDPMALSKAMANMSDSDDLPDLPDAA